VLLVLLIGFYRWRIGYREQIKDLEKLAAMDQERLRIARDLHDDLGAGLTRIAVSCDAALIGTDKEDPKLSKRIQKAADLSRALAASISELVWSNDPRNDQLDVVIARLRAHVAQVAEENQWRLEFDVDGRLPMELRLDVRQRRHLLLAFKEVIQNIQKHALAKSVCISVTLGSNQTVSNTTLEVRVCDDGCGFDLSHTSDRDDGWQEVKTGNGLRNLRDRMQEIEGGVEIVTKMDNGTSLTLAIPVNLP
jgi:signal transduction histidine kinase